MQFFSWSSNFNTDRKRIHLAYLCQPLTKTHRRKRFNVIYTHRDPFNYTRSLLQLSPATHQYLIRTRATRPCSPTTTGTPESRTRVRAATTMSAAATSPCVTRVAPFPHLTSTAQVIVVEIVFVLLLLLEMD